METLFLDAVRTMTVEELRERLRRGSKRHDTLSIVHTNAIKSELRKRAVNREWRNDAT